MLLLLLWRIDSDENRSIVSVIHNAANARQNANRIELTEREAHGKVVCEYPDIPKSVSDEPAAFLMLIAVI